MKDYGAMSNKELNKIVAMRQIKDSCHTWQIFDDGDVVIGESESNLRSYDPCGSWIDAGKLIEENEISINSLFLDRPVWEAFGGPCLEYNIIDDNPLRAVVIVYLLMAEGV